MLEVGTGTGGVAHYFATHPELDCSVDAVDVVDGRRITEGYSFHLVHGPQLPFADDSFDVVLSNHVTEHLGEQSEQLAPLSELRRVLPSGGIGYLAAPNPRTFVGPRYPLAFLSGAPHAWHRAYLGLTRPGSFYVGYPFKLHQIE